MQWHRIEISLTQSSKVEVIEDATCKLKELKLVNFESVATKGILQPRMKDQIGISSTNISLIISINSTCECKCSKDKTSN